MNAMHLNAVFEWVVDENDLHSCTCKSWGAISLNKLTKIVFTVFHNVLQTFCNGPNNGGPLLAKFHEGPDPRILAGSTPMILSSSRGLTWSLCSQLCQTSLTI